MRFDTKSCNVPGAQAPVWGSTRAPDAAVATEASAGVVSAETDDEFSNRADNNFSYADFSFGTRRRRGHERVGDAAALWRSTYGEPAVGDIGDHSELSIRPLGLTMTHSIGG
jgi:hypothetical protein